MFYPVNEAILPLKREICDLKNVICAITMKCHAEVSTQTMEMAKDDMENQNIKKKKAKTNIGKVQVAKEIEKNKVSYSEIVKKPSVLRSPRKAVDVAVDEIRTSQPTSGNDEGKFELVRPRRQRNIVIGSKTDNSLVAAEKELDFHVWRLLPETSVEQVTNFIEKSLTNSKVKKARQNQQQSNFCNLNFGHLAPLLIEQTPPYRGPSLTRLGVINMSTTSERSRYTQQVE